MILLWDGYRGIFTVGISYYIITYMLYFRNTPRIENIAFSPLKAPIFSFINFFGFLSNNACISLSFLLSYQMLVNASFNVSHSKEVQRMAKCEFCDKGVTFGIKVSHSHRRSNRPWKPNVKRVKAMINGTPRHVYVCTRCLRSGKVTRAI